MFRSTDLRALSSAAAQENPYRTTAWFAVYFIQMRQGEAQRFPYAIEDYTVRSYMFLAQASYWFTENICDKQQQAITRTQEVPPKHKDTLFQCEDD